MTKMIIKKQDNYQDDIENKTKQIEKLLKQNCRILHITKQDDDIVVEYEKTNIDFYSNAKQKTALALINDMIGDYDNCDQGSAAKEYRYAKSQQKRKFMVANVVLKSDIDELNKKLNPFGLHAKLNEISATLDMGITIYTSKNEEMFYIDGANTIVSNHLTRMLPYLDCHMISSRREYSFKQAMALPQIYAIISDFMQTHFNLISIERCSDND